MPVCTCVEGFTGDGFTCKEITTTKMPKLQCQAKYCYGYGDPHYRSVAGIDLFVNNTCSYVMVADSCNSSVRSNFSVTTEQFLKDGQAENYFIKLIKVHYGGDEYVLGKNVMLNGVDELKLPFNDLDFQIYEMDGYIVFDHMKLNLFWDRKGMVMIRNCMDVGLECGLCGLEKGYHGYYPYKEHLSKADTNCTAD